MISTSEDFNTLTRTLRGTRPYSQCYFACEGANTEPKYFRALRKQRKFLGINDNIQIEVLKKGKKQNHTRPEILTTWALSALDDKISEGNFDSTLDTLIIVFDSDIAKSDAIIQSIIHQVSEKNKELCAGTRRPVTGNGPVHLMVTNPSFELFLLLHKNGDSRTHANNEDVDERSMGAIEIITKHHAGILANGKHPAHTKQRYVCGLVSQIFHKNPKSGTGYINFVKNVKVAIKNEKDSIINKDINCTTGQLTSNVGLTIEKLFFA